MISALLAKPSTQAFMIFIGALVLYSVAPFRDFFRDEDYEMAYQTASFYRSYMPMNDGLGLLDSFFYRAGMFIHSLFFYRHGAVPAIYFSGFYAAFDALGLPFSARLLGWPTAVLGAASCVVLYFIFLHTRLPKALSFVGAMILVVSPLFAGLSRGAGTYVWIAPIFSFLLCILALQRLNKKPARQYFMAFALINLILCDALFFLSFAALAAAYGLRDVTVLQAFRHPIQTVLSTKPEISRLLAPRISIPVAIVLATLILSALFVVKFGHAFQGTLPLNSILLATSKHADFGLYGLTLDSHWIDYPSVLLGEAGPVTLVMALVSAFWRHRRSTEHAFLWWVVGIAGSGFVFLIYVIVRPNDDVTYGYQIYTLIPLVMLVVLSANRLIEANPALKPWLYGALWAHIAISGMSTGAYLFKWPTAIFTVYDVEVFGVTKPDYGTKAAGYLARQIISTNLRLDPQIPIRIDIFRDPERPFPQKNYGGFRVYSAPFMANAALVQNGNAYAYELDLQPQLSSRVADEEQAATLNAEYRCPAELCVAFRTQDESAELQIYDVHNEQEKLLARLFVAVPHPIELPPGRYMTGPLNESFDRSYQAFEDFFPPRPTAKKKRILQSLKDRFSL